MSENRWIKFVNGKFSAVYRGDKINANGYTVTVDSTDEELFEAGILRLYSEEDLDPVDPELDRVIVGGPFYTLDPNGKAAAIERWQWAYEDIEEIKFNLIQSGYNMRDQLLKDGVEFKGHTFDLRFRNLSYMSLIATLINNDKFEESFSWYSSDGKLVEFTKEEFLEFFYKITTEIRDMEHKFYLLAQKIEKIDNRFDLRNFNILENYEKV
jgi:hypothetical protein